jgi:hypothetical protein
MTNLTFEVPHKHLEDFKDLQDFHFALSLHCQWKAYRDFFKRQAVKGVKQVWLDNSFNETGKADSLTKLFKLAYQLGAHKIIIPDNPEWSVKKVVTQYNQAINLFSPASSIVVINSFEMMTELEDQGAECFALSYHVRLPYYNNGGLPGHFLWAKECHFLGLCSIRELQEIQPLSCDTSVPIKLALKGISIRQWYEDGCPRIHRQPGDKGKLVYYDIEMTKEQIELARQNILNLKYAVNNMRR